MANENENGGQQETVHSFDYLHLNSYKSWKCASIFHFNRNERLLYFSRTTYQLKLKQLHLYSALTPIK